ncbi:MAG: MFS transporter, partial [Aggregatilineales bacterium]
GDAVLFSGYTSFDAGLHHGGFTLINRVYSEQMVTLGIGLLLATIGMGQFFTQIVLLPRMLARYGDATLVVVGAMFRALSMYTFAVIASPFLGPLAAVPFAIGAGLMMPPLQSLSTNTVPDEARGGVLGWYQSATSLSTIFATASSGVIFSISPRVPYWLGGTLFLVAILPAIVLWRSERQKQLTAQPVEVAIP